MHPAISPLKQESLRLTNIFNQIKNIGFHVIDSPQLNIMMIFYG